MAGMVLIAAIGIFGAGIFVGIIFTVSRGIRRERQRYEEAQRYREAYGVLDSTDSRGHFIPSEAPDAVSLVARGFNGLYVRRPAVRKHDAELATLA
jgi:hypothetical protein